MGEVLMHLWISTEDAKANCHFIRSGSSMLVYYLLRLVERSQRMTTDKAVSVILDIENLVHSQDKCSSPILTKALSRKGSCRNDRRSTEEHETEDASKKLVVKAVNSQMDPFISNKPLVLVTEKSLSSSTADSNDVRSKRIKTIRPKEILLIFATLSSVGTLILIYFTLTAGH